MRARRWLGWGILLGVAAAVAAWALLGGRGAADGVLVGLVSDEPAPYLADPDLAALLAERYGLALRARPASAAEMLRAGAEDADFFLAAAHVAEAYRLAGGAAARSATVARSPLVLYTWAEYLPPLEAAGLVGRAGDGTLTVSLPRLAEAALAGRTWPDLGLPGLPAPLALALPEPARSDVGALLAWEGARATESTVAPVGTPAPPSLGGLSGFRALLAGQGYRYRSSGDLFRLYWSQGPGAFPLAAGAEADWLAYRTAHPADAAALRGEVHALYLQPAAWVDWTVVALSDRAVPLIDALRSAEAQRLALERYGLRGDPAQPAALPADLPALPGAAQPPDAASVLAVLRALEE